MVEQVIRMVDRNISFKEVTASRGKVQHCEPVGALYEQGKVSHIGDLTALENQMCAMTSQGYQGDGSPDRVDALV
jgi:phage terminase large subunit-like protein